MEIPFRIDDGVVIIAVEDTIVLHEVAVFLEENTDKWIGYPVIWDINNATLGKIDTIELKSFVRNIKATVTRRPHDKTALVSSSDLLFGMLRMYEILSDILGSVTNRKSFRSMDEAKKWVKESS